MNKQFLGYQRPDGSVGIRNYVLVLPVQRQVNVVAQKIAEIVPDTKAFICAGEMGRPREDRLVLYRTLVGLGLNPNAASVLIVGSRREAGYADHITHPGLYFMDAWMSSLSLPTGYAASGAQLFLYQMGGQGIPGIEFPAPAVSSGIVIPIMYLTGNSNTFKRAHDIIDFNSGTVLDDLETLDEAGERLQNWILKVASGAKTKAETINYEDPIELYLQGPVL